MHTEQEGKERRVIYRLSFYMAPKTKQVREGLQDTSRYQTNLQ